MYLKLAVEHGAEEE